VFISFVQSGFLGWMFFLFVRHENKKVGFECQDKTISSQVFYPFLAFLQEGADDLCLVFNRNLTLVFCQTKGLFKGQ
jgi:hypothetical protein